MSLDRDAVQSALQQLPDDQRQPLLLAYFEGLTHVEISEKLSVPLGTVKSRMRLGLDKLRVALGGRS
jgi:RNA polymerase sigma-70 factor (ECF subfamily)